MCYLSRYSDKYQLDHLFNIGRMPVLSVLLLFAVVVSSCTPSTPVAEADYAKEIVGSWQGSVGGKEESLTFNADGGFVAQIRAQGFISNTLSQGSTGMVRGSWILSDAAITLTVTSTEGERLENSTTSSTILSFTTNELEMKSSQGETSKFVR
jgi:hypothetical protein